MNRQRCSPFKSGKLSAQSRDVCHWPRLRGPLAERDWDTFGRQDRCPDSEQRQRDDSHDGGKRRQMHCGRWRSRRLTLVEGHRCNSEPVRTLKAEFSRNSRRLYTTETKFPCHGFNVASFTRCSKPHYKKPEFRSETLLGSTYFGPNFTKNKACITAKEFSA